MKSLPRSRRSPAHSRRHCLPRVELLEDRAGPTSLAGGAAPASSPSFPQGLGASLDSVRGAGSLSLLADLLSDTAPGAGRRTPASVDAFVVSPNGGRRAAAEAAGESPPRATQTPTPPPAPRLNVQKGEADPLSASIVVAAALFRDPLSEGPFARGRAEPHSMAVVGAARARTTGPAGPPPREVRHRGLPRRPQRSTGLLACRPGRAGTRRIRRQPSPGRFWQARR
jgi:hypothetical protein